VEGPADIEAITDDLVFADGLSRFVLHFGNSAQVGKGSLQQA